MCLRNFQNKYLLQGALIEAEILTSPLHHVFAQLGLDYGLTSTQLMGVPTPPKWSTNVPMCLRNLQTKYVVHGTLMETETLTSPPPNVFVQSGLGFG